MCACDYECVLLLYCITPIKSRRFHNRDKFLPVNTADPRGQRHLVLYNLAQDEYTQCMDLSIYAHITRSSIRSFVGEHKAAQGDYR